LKCPGADAEVLLEIQDVTSKVNASAEGATGSADANQRRKAAMTEIEKECTGRTGNRCRVVKLYSGGEYHLYRSKRYDDVRLVFAPEVAIAAFGGDPDNFTYPRYCLDFTFLRAYENGKPAVTPNYLRWSHTGVKEGELIFVSGHPGTTGRLDTMAALEFYRDHSFPLYLRLFERLIADLKTYSAQNPENKRVAGDSLFVQQNSFKAYKGFLAGLKDIDLMNRKRDEQKTLEGRSGGQLSPTLRAVEQAYQAYGSFVGEYTLFERLAGRSSELLPIAIRVTRYSTEKAKPDGERLREYTGPALPGLESVMYSPAPIHESLEIAALASYFRSLDAELGTGHPVVARILNGEEPEKAAAGYVRASRLSSVDERKRLANDQPALAASTDGMIRLARLIESEGRKYRKLYEDRVEAVLTEAASGIAQARFQVYGASAYPDATSTLRISFGPVKGYRDADGRVRSYATDFDGLYARATQVEPFRLPPSWLRARKKLRRKTPFNFVTTADTHGGNSGSPTVNMAGEVVGILFDGNIESLPNRFVYRDERERSVHVASQGIVEALGKVYRAESVLRELGVVTK
jgi:hypothetical protein